jgi:hypothetical protein
MRTLNDLLEAIQKKVEIKGHFNRDTEISMRYGQFSPSCGHLGSEISGYGIEITLEFLEDGGIFKSSGLSGAINVAINGEEAYLIGSRNRLCIPLRNPFEEFVLYVTI